MSEPSRRSLLRLGGRIAAAGVVGGLAAHGAWQSAAPAASSPRELLGRDLRVGYLPITDAAALLTAHDRGLWHDAGLPSAEPVLFRSWEALAQAFVVGEVDVVHLLMPLALQLRLQNDTPLRVIGWGHTNGSALVTLPSITETSHLAGTKVAVPYWWSIHSVLTQQLLTSAGLTPIIGRPPGPREVQLVVMPPAEMVAALAAEQIAGYAVADPFNAMAEVQGVGRVHRLLGDVWRDHACCAVTVRQDLIDEHPDAVHAIADGLVGAQAWLNGNREEGAARLTDGGYLPQPPPAIQRAISRPADAGAVHPHWHGERLGFSAFPHSSYTEQLVGLMSQTVVDGDRSFLDGLSPSAAHSQLVDDRFIRAALSRAGLPIEPRTEEVAP
ncbi:MAG: ABC transporter substrate-binding protein [Propionibacteriaceae bacterium]|nr:ABC transporter substrate-binding protein [Propionibacteriaceae bacterium]